MDKKLDELLDTYTVEPADPALLQHIMRLATEEDEARKARTAEYPWFARAAVMAAVGVFGFWLGTAHVTQDADVTTASATAGSAAAATEQHGYMEKIILGPSSMDEVLL
ncbi:MAG: hypothetical protein PW788_09010 [Micavibrio sp.]|nr:hypothetical protein [Micavibrio sp.]